MIFDDFWQLYPRKTAKAHAKIMWERLTEEEKKLAIEKLPQHIKLWSTTGTEKQFMPHAGTWLNPVLGRRWEDEIEIPSPKAKTKTEIAWWSSESLIISKGRELNLDPRPGEVIEQFKGRIIEKIRSA